MKQVLNDEAVVRLAALIIHMYCLSSRCESCIFDSYVGCMLTNNAVTEWFTEQGELNK